MPVHQTEFLTSTLESMEIVILRIIAQDGELQKVVLTLKIGMVITCH